MVALRSTVTSIRRTGDMFFETYALVENVCWFILKDFHSANIRVLMAWWYRHRHRQTQAQAHTHTHRHTHTHTYFLHLIAGLHITWIN